MKKIDAYYFTAIDFESGRTAYRVLTGTGVRYDNNWASISLAPDGTAFVGVLNGVVRVRDNLESAAAKAAPREAGLGPSAQLNHKTTHVGTN